MAPSESTAQLELFRALGRVSRGLAALFWGLPLAVIVLVRTASKTRSELEPFDLIAPVGVMMALFYGVQLLASFRPQERIWHQALDRARIFALVNLGLSPFLYCWVRFREQPFFAACAGILVLSSLLFLSNLNAVLRRLADMLPDQTLREEVRFFSMVNLYLLAALPFLILCYILLWRWSAAPAWLLFILQRAEFLNPWVVLFLFLVPLAMTMSLIWKTREVVLHGLFGERK